LTTLVVTATDVVMNISVVMSNRTQDARAAMAALIESRSLSMHEGEKGYAELVAARAWEIADAMAAERTKRTGGKPTIPPPPDSMPPETSPRGKRR
jgi:GMP synthase PP-ATPase subunit